MPEAPDRRQRRPDVSDPQGATRTVQPVREDRKLANRKLRWVYLDANWSF
jgi:hypothetical protein